MNGAFDLCRGCGYCEHHLSQVRPRVSNSGAMLRITLLVLAAVSLLVLGRTPQVEAQTRAQKSVLEKKLLGVHSPTYSSGRDVNPSILVGVNSCRECIALKCPGVVSIASTVVT